MSAPAGEPFKINPSVVLPLHPGDKGDLDLWNAANPSLGIRINPQFLAGELHGLAQAVHVPTDPASPDGDVGG